MLYKSCTADVLTKEEDKDSGDYVVGIERYRIARGEDPLDEVDIGESAGAPRLTFISHNLAPKLTTARVAAGCPELEGGL
ncbi:hypothetical protein Droror1_Dr00025327 [Drosera rotundifolia]